LPLAGPAVAGACMAADAGQRRRWVSLQQGDYWFRQTPHAVARSRPQLLWSCLTRQIRFRCCCEQRIHFSAACCCGETISTRQTLAGSRVFNLVYLSMSFRQKLALPFYPVPCRYCFVRVRIGSCPSPDRLRIGEQDHQIQQQSHEKAVTIFRQAV
jgi:hypothetical protein